VRGVYKGFYDSRVRIELGMWRKGKAIDVFFRGVKNTISYYELEKRTDRRRANLKQWHKLYKKYPTKAEFLPIAEEKAQEWTDKVFNKVKALPEPEGKEVGDESPEPKDKVKKKQVVMDSIDEVCRKLNHRLSKFGELNTLGKPKMFTQKKDDYTGLLMLVDSQELKQLRATLNKIFRLEKDRPVI